MDLKIFTRSPSTQPNIPVLARFDPFCEDFQHSPGPTYKYLRESIPALYWEEGQAWLLSRYDHVIAILKDSRFEACPRPSLFIKRSSIEANKPDATTENNFGPHSPLSRDRIDRFIAIFFSKDKIDLLHSTIVNIVDQQLSQFRAPVDLVTKYSDRIAIRVLASVCAIPDKYLLIFSQLCYNCLGIHYQGDELSKEQIAHKYMHIDIGLALLKQIIDQRRSSGRREYLIDLILSYKAHGEALSDAEILEFILNLIVGSFESMSLLISSSIYTIFSNRKSLKLLQKNDELWPHAVLEALRYDFFIKLDNPRYALEDCYIDDTRIKSGDKVYALTAAALHDPAFIQLPNNFDITRRQLELLEYGYREHDYFGKNLIVRTAVIAASRFFKAYPSANIDPPSYYPSHKCLRTMSSLIMTPNLGKRWPDIHTKHRPSI